jgi:hypothetical protein
MLQAYAYASAMFLLMSVGNDYVWLLGWLQRLNVRSRFRENRFTDLKMLMGDIHTQHDYITNLYLFSF